MLVERQSAGEPLLDFVPPQPPGPGDNHTLRVDRLPAHLAGAKMILELCAVSLRQRLQHEPLEQLGIIR